MPASQVNKSISFPGYSFNEQATPVTFDNAVAYEITIPALNAAQSNGTLTTRTDDNTGVVTLSTGHGIITSDVCDVYWTGGMRYGMDATVSSNAVTLDGGGGDNLPTESTTGIQVVKQTTINPLYLDGDAAEIVAVIYRNTSDTGAKAHIDFQDAGDASIEELDLVHETANGGLSRITNISAGDTNIYTGNVITKGFASHDSTSAGILYVLAGIDSTP